MKLKKKAKRILVIFLILLVIVLGVLAFKDKIFGNNESGVKEIKVVNKIEKYGYNLKENKPKAYKKMFEE